MQIAYLAIIAIYYLPYLTLPFGAGVLPPSAEASRFIMSSVNILLLL